MNNKLKLFYIFIIGVLMASIVHAVNHIEWMGNNAVGDINRVNKNIRQNNAQYLVAQQENVNLKCENAVLKCDIQALERLLDEKP